MKKNKLKLTPWMIIKRGHYAYFFYYWLYGLIKDYKLAGRSLSDTIFNKRKDAYPVQCISYPYIEELVKKLDISEDDVFVDVGCAWGRLLGYLCAHTSVKSLVGVELNEEVAKCATEIFKNEPKVTIVAGDVIEKLPIEGTVFYLFNPFDETIMKQFLDAIQKRIKHPVKILYLHPTCRQVLDAENSGWELVEEMRLKPKHLGALTLCVYWNGK